MLSSHSLLFPRECFVFLQGWLHSITSSSTKRTYELNRVPAKRNLFCYTDRTWVRADNPRVSYPFTFPPPLEHKKWASCRFVVLRPRFIQSTPTPCPPHLVRKGRLPLTIERSFMHDETPSSSC
ncbi:unnamed protein product [Ectocarpus fasciculatus]